MHIRAEKYTPAHQGKFSPAPPSPFTSAFAAHSVKGRFAFRSATLLSTLDCIARLRPTLLTMAAPGEISFRDRNYQKTENGPKTSYRPPSSFSVLPAPCFLGVSFSLFVDESEACRVNATRFPPPPSMLSSIGAFACPVCSLRFPKVCLFVRRHPGGPAYGTCTRAAALYPFRLARGSTPSNPARPSKDSGLAEGKRR